MDGHCHLSKDILFRRPLGPLRRLHERHHFDALRESESRNGAKDRRSNGSKKKGLTCPIIAAEAANHPNLLCVALCHTVADGHKEPQVSTLGNHAFVKS
jgi:hypothetical protein